MKEIIYRAVTTGKNGTLIKRESHTLMTFAKLIDGTLIKKDFVKSLDKVVIIYHNNKPVSANAISLFK